MILLRVVYWAIKIFGNCELDEKKYKIIKNSFFIDN